MLVTQLFKIEVSNPDAIEWGDNNDSPFCWYTGKTGDWFAVPDKFLSESEDIEAEYNQLEKWLDSCDWVVSYESCFMFSSTMSATPPQTDSYQWYDVIDWGGNGAGFVFTIPKK